MRRPVGVEREGWRSAALFLCDFCTLTYTEGRATEYVSIVAEHDRKEKRRLRLPIEAPFRQIRRGPECRLVECDAYGQMGHGFQCRPAVRPEILGGLRIRSEIRARIPASHFGHAHEGEKL
jgi:hypothetical protein